MRRIFLMFLTMTAISLANAQQREAELFLKRWNAAMVAADTAALGAMMDDGIVLHHMSGATQSKRGVLIFAGRSAPSEERESLP